MRIGLISDTHIPDHVKELPPELMEALRGVDLILHAGDIYTPSVLDELEQIAPVLAARGDDDYLTELSDKRVKEKHVLKIKGHTIWLVHERAYYITSSWLQSRAQAGQDENDFPDIVIFGHEHRTLVQRFDGILFFCPGSPTFLGYRNGLGTAGILYLSSREVELSILRL